MVATRHTIPRGGNCWPSCPLIFTRPRNGEVGTLPDSEEQRRRAAPASIWNGWRGLFLVAVCLVSGMARSQEIHVDAQDTSAAESEYYRLVTLPLPNKVQCEAGAMTFLPDGRVALGTRIGDIWIGTGLLDEPATPKWSRFASGLHEVLGLAYKDGAFYATQRPEVTRITDTKGTGRGDLFETVSDGWGIKGDYHEFAFGSKFDRDGNLWVLLCLTGSFTSDSPFRGWAMRITPEGKMIPTCDGIRSPSGVGFNAKGEVFYTDQQGSWNGTCPLRQLIPGEFEGNPEGLKWFDDPQTAPLIEAAGIPRPPQPHGGNEARLVEEAKRIPELHPPAVYFPYYKLGQSSTGILCDLTDGKFGPFQEQLFVGDLTHSMVMRVFLEKVNGRYQGAAFPFRRGFDSGNIALEYAPDGSMFVFGSNRGWGCVGPKPFALQRLVWTGKTPFEIKEMRAKPDGFDLQFTQPVDPKTAALPASYQLETYTYIYHADYGSPEVDKTVPTVRSVTVSSDGLSARLLIDGLVEGHVHEIHLLGVRSAEGKALLHDVAYYTLNALPKATEPVMAAAGR